ncbi:hypothetical protein N9023_03425 [Opitutaceae bacterium]|nr:hypothetical protein [Opitutaceae bacterium]
MASALAAEPISVGSQSAPVRDHHLFVGINLFLADGTEEVKVHKLQGEAAILDTPERRRINLIETSGLRWKMATKVSANLVTIDDLELVETFTNLYGEGRDRISNQIGIQIMADQNLDRAELSARGEGQLNMGSAGSISDAGGDLGEETQSIIDQAVSLQGSLSEAGMLGAAPGDSADQAPNAMEITFKISSAHLITDAHVFGTAVIQTDEGIRDAIFHEHVGKVDAKPKKVTILQPGMPSNFEIKQSTIHVFNHGEEFATNHAEKHYELTVAEAVEFVRLDHQGNHRRETVPAKPVWPLAPARLHAATRSREFDFPVTVTISANGELQSIEGNELILPEHVREAVKQMTFLPALEAGHPRESTLTFNPADFFKE